MHGRDAQSAAIAENTTVVIEGKDLSQVSSTLSRDPVPGELPPGKQVGDVKPDGL